MKKVLKYDNTSEVSAYSDEHPFDELWEQSAKEQEPLIMPSRLTPGGNCLGDGLHEGYTCLCDECDYLAWCFTEFDKE